MKTIPEMLTFVTGQYAERTAIVDGEKILNYSTLGKGIDALASVLCRSGIRRGDRVALMLPNGVDFVTAFFGISKAGAIVVPLNHHYQQTELRYFLDECDVSLVLTSKDFAPLCQQVLPLLKSPCRIFWTEDFGKSLEPGNPGDLKVEIDPQDPVMYQYSSGTTGRPKRIGRTHAHLLFELKSLIQTLDITPDDRFLGVAPFSHVNGLMRSMMASLRAGATLYPLPRFDRQGFAEAIEKNRISIFIGVPFMPSMLAKSHFRRRPAFSALRLCVTASAPMPQRLNQQFHEQFGIYVRQLYGSTETGTISVNLSPDIERSLGSVGTPISGVEVKVVTEQGQPARTDEIGEVAVKSEAAIRGYHGSDELNREVFRDGYFFTGDLGKTDGDGLLYLVGRKKFLINRGGYKIDPHEIEDLLESHPRVEEAAVVGIPTSFGDEKVKAVIVLNGACTEEQLVEYCRGKIADFKIPSLVQFRDSLPRGPTGKIRRSALVSE